MFLRSSLLLLLACFCAASAQAQQDTPSPLLAKADDATRLAAKTDGSVATAAASPTPAKKPGLFRRIFHKEEPVATPTPATPTPRRRYYQRRPNPAPASDDDKADNPKLQSNRKPASDKPDTDKPDENGSKPPAADTTASGTTSTDEKADPAATPVSRGRKRGKGTATSAPANPGAPKTKEQEALEAAVAGGDPDAIEKAKYDEAKSRAIADEHVQELRGKAEEATSEDDARKALRAYNKALFQKMRTLNPEIEGRVNKMETAVMKQLDAKEN